MTRLLFFALLAVAIAEGTGCTRTPAGSSTAAPAPKAEAAPAADPSAILAPPWADPKKPVPAQLPDVLARVNGEAVTKVDFDRLVKNMEASAGQPIPADRRDELLRGALEELVTLTVLSQETKSRNIAVTDAEITSNIAEVRKSFRGNDQEFQQALAARGMTSEQMRTDAGVQLRINKMMQDEVSTVAGPSDADARAFYDKNPDQFKPEEIRASHILFGVNQNADEATISRTRARADSVLKQAQGGAEFAGLARRHSDDSSKQQGGDLGFFRRGKLPPEFEQVAFSLKPGQMSEVVVTSFGFHIIRVAERRVAPLLPFEQVNGQIREMLFAQRKEARAKSFVDALKKKAKIEVLI